MPFLRVQFLSREPPAEFWPDLARRKEIPGYAPRADPLCTFLTGKSGLFVARKSGEAIKKAALFLAVLVIRARKRGKHEPILERLLPNSNQLFGIFEWQRLEEH